MPTKDAIRKRMRDKRSAIPTDEWRARSEQISIHLLRSREVQDAKTIFAYVSVGREPDTRHLLLELLKEGRTIIAPGTDELLDPIKCLHFLRADDPILLSRGNATPFEPVTCDAVDVRDIDLFLIPGLAYDRAGNRIGQGGGYFDRLLDSARSSATIIGLSFDLQIVERITPDVWDVAVDWVATESGLICATG